MTAREAGLALVVLGAVAIVVGALVASGLLSWFGRLPGDIRLTGDNGNVRVYVPITSMLLLSLVLSVVLTLVRRLLE